MRTSSRKRELEELSARVRDIETKLDHALFMLAECRRLRRCELCRTIYDETES